MTSFRLLIAAASITALISYIPVTNAEEPIAGFQELIAGTAVLGDGTEVEVNFPIAFEKHNNAWYFRAGNQRVAMFMPPAQYNMQLAVQEQDAMVYLAEFSNRYMRSFKVKIGEHELELIPSEGVKYGIRLRIDDRIMMFDKRTPTVSVQLDATGVTGFRSEGFVRDLSTRRVE